MDIEAEEGHGVRHSREEDEATAGKRRKVGDANDDVLLGEAAPARDSAELPATDELRASPPVGPVSSQ